MSGAIMSVMIWVPMLILAVVLNELGHFAFLKKIGVRVKEFKLGWGKKLCGVKIGDTDFTLCPLPIGGACIIDDDALAARSPWEQFLVFVTGPMVNIALAVGFAFGMLQIANPDNSMLMTDCIRQFVTNLGDAMLLVADRAFYLLSNLGTAFGLMVSANESGIQANNELIVQTVQMHGILYSICMSGCALNVVLFVINLLPIPPLDGGQAVLALFELLHIHVPQRGVQTCSIVIYTAMITLMMYAAVKDVLLLFV